MIGILHNFIPNPILLDLGVIQITWYGFFLALGMVVGTLVSLKLGSFFNFKKEKLIDLAFYLIVFGVLGARIYDVFLELPYYINHPGQILQIWKGGLAIHGGIIAGVITLYFFAKKQKVNFWQTAMICVPGLSIAQAIGRFGNYFNQELFGKATDLAWGIPIESINRPIEYLQSTHFHPTFLYESLGLVIIFVVLLKLISIKSKKDTKVSARDSSLIVSFYVLSYSLLRFFLEFVRVDYAPEIFSIKVPQIMSLTMAIIAIFIFAKNYEKQEKQKV